MWPAPNAGIFRKTGAACSPRNHGHRSDVTPLVSILIPCYNAGRWLAATLESALAQTDVSCQVIVIDDGSKDDSARIAAAFQSRGVTCLAQPNRGAAAARNTALQAARGDFVQFLDADDLLAPDKISRQLAALAHAPADALAAGPWGTFAGTHETATFEPQAVWADHAPIDWLVSSWSGGGMFPPIAWLTPRRVLERAGPWDETLTLDDDGEYFTRVLLQSSAVRFVPEARSYYRSHDGPRLSDARGLAAARSSHRSCVSKERLLLAAEDSPRTRHAVASHWQRFAWEQFTAAPELAAAALSRARQLAPDLPPPAGSASYRFLARLLGWPRARRLQLRWQNWQRS